LLQEYALVEVATLVCGPMVAPSLKMYDWQDFNNVFQSRPDYAPDHKQVEAVLKHRKELGGLFFDKIWSSLGLKQRRASV